MDRRRRALGGGKHRRLPAQPRLIGVLRQVPALSFQRHDIPHLRVNGLKLVDP